MNAKDRGNLERAMRYAAKAQTFLTRIEGDYRSGLGGADNHLNCAIECVKVIADEEGVLYE